MERIFLNNDRPLLHLTADYLIDRFYKEGQLDLRNVILVLQEKRAINRLEEILAEKAETLDPAWYPPEFMTIGTLPERLYELKKNLADDLTQYFAWLTAIDKLNDENPDLLHRLIPVPPKRDDLEARLALGKMFAKLHLELAADTLDFVHVAELCRKLKIKSEAQRWEALAELQEEYLATLDTLGIWDKQSARLYALEHPIEEFVEKHAHFLGEDTQILLVGVADMNLVQKEMLRYFQDFVTPLVFAPENWANRFDDFGCLIPHVWQDIHIELHDKQIRIVESADEQAEEVLRCLTHLQGKYAPPEIIVGVPDKQIVPFIERQFEQTEIKSRIVAGRTIQQTSVYRFLETLLAYLETPTFANFAALVRHPKVETFLQLHNERPEAGVPAKWTLITKLDRYHTDSLPVDGPFFLAGTPGLTQLSDLLASQDLADILATIFSDKSRDDAYHKVLDALAQIREVTPELLSTLSFIDTVRLILFQIGTATIPMPHEPDAVELVGWLDLAMDDAEVIIVTGMNDGSVPAFQTSDMFLPDTMRRNLKIEDNSRRYARDAYALTCLLATRQYEPQRVQLIGSRRSVEGDPLLPSRLFFADTDEIVTKRVKRFFAEHREVPTRIQFADDTEKPEAVFDSPKVPADAGKSIREMSVTEFAEYKKCPYRYYLKYRVTPRLRTLHDADTELPAWTFGSLIHDTLEEFGQAAGIKDSTSADAIRDFLVSKVQELARQRYGEHPRPVIAIQAERAIKRLEAFAEKQADWAAEYEILATELTFESEQFFLDVDGDVMRLKGRIDRVDRHRKTNALVILDYKTAGKPADPRHHLKNKEEWIDFQLPLYYHLLSQHAGYKDFLERGFQLGYVVLPADVSKTDRVLTNWDRSLVLSAVDAAREIVRCIWRSEFEKVSPPPRYSEAFAAICGDF